MYGAIANGRLAYSPIRRVPKIAVSTVTTIEGPAGIPATLRIAGLTAIMYDIVKNVVRPATISRRIVVPALSRPKYCAIALFIFLSRYSAVSRGQPRQPDYARRRVGLQLSRADCVTP